MSRPHSLLCLGLLVALSSSLLAQPGEFQVNSPASSMDIDGVIGTSNTPAISTRAQGSTARVTMSTTLVGSFFEVIVGAQPTRGRSMGGVSTPAGQVINVFTADPSIFYLSSGTAIPTFSLFFGVPRFVLPLQVPSSLTALTISGQMAVVDPSTSDGITLSQACELNGRVDWGGYTYNPSSLVCPPYVTPTTLGNDDIATLNLQAPLNFYGTSQTQVFVHSNGFVTLGSPGSPTIIPSAASFNLGAPMIAPCAMDFDPSVQGSVSIGTAGPTFDVCWTNVPHAATLGSNSFRLQVNPGGIFTFYDPGMTATDCFVGFSAGGAINPSQAFNWSWIGGPNMPESYINSAGLPLSGYQEFTAAEPFDIAGQGLIWLFDGTGTPVTSP